MSETLPVIYLARHGETAWTETQQHTRHSDLPLTESGKESLPVLEEAISAGVPINVTDPNRCLTMTVQPTI